MDVSGSLQVPPKKYLNNPRRRRAEPSSAAPAFIGDKDPNIVCGEIEVEVAKKSMKVSPEAWRAFQVYQQYEDWPNETEKTDYTYSRLSTHRHKEVIPGFPVRPNLCRSPIKPSTRGSLFDYTTELEQAQNYRNARKSYFVQKEVVTEDTTDNIEIVERFSVFQRLIQSLTLIWSLLVVSSATTARRLGAGLSFVLAQSRGSFLSFWSHIKTVTSFIGTSMGSCCSRFLRRDVSTKEENNSVHTVIQTGFFTWIVTRVHTVTTSVTNIYHSAAYKNQQMSKKRYLLLLLLPFILFTGWLLVNKESKEAVVSLISPSTSALCELWTSSVRAMAHFSGATLQKLSVLWESFCGLLGYQTASFVIESATDLYSYLSQFFYTISEHAKSLLLFGSSSLTKYSIVLFESVTGSLESVMHLLWFSYNQTDGNEVESPLLREVYLKTEETVDEVSSREDSSYIAAIQKRIALLEDMLQNEKLLRSAEGAKLDATLKNYDHILQSQRLSSDWTLRSCCRRQYLSSRPLPVLISPPSTGPTLEDLERLVAEMREQSSAELALIRAEVTAAVAAKNDALSVEDYSFDAGAVKRIVGEAIKKYDADKTGRADYALESAGGRVVSIRCTRVYSNKGYPTWGFPMFWTTSSKPEDAIRPSTAPGECWSFQGSVGYLALELSYPVKVTGFTMEHISKTLSPSGTIDSAPKHFSMWGLKDADDLYEQYLLGEYVYEDTDETIQYFPVKYDTDTIYKFVELKIISNHGHPDYTCLYRIRVHGTVPS